MNLHVLFEDNHLFVVSKPAGALVQGDATGDESLYGAIAAYRKQNEQKPGAAFVGLVHRLDRPVSGVVVFAKTSKAAARLARQFREGTVEKRYIAVAERRSSAPIAPGEPCEWQDYLHKDPQSNRVRVVDSREAGAKLARTIATPLESAGELTLWELHPLTGRSHQLRVQLSRHCGPIVGDLRYGSGREFSGQLALHARSLTLQHPTLKSPMTFEAPLPTTWKRFPFSSTRNIG